MQLELVPLAEDSSNFPVAAEENTFRPDCTWEERFQPNFPVHSDSLFAVERVEREALGTPCIAEVSSYKERRRKYARKVEPLEDDLSC